MTVKIKRERPDQRRHHRVTAPLFIRVEGHELRVSNWSLGGLRVDGYPGVLPTAGSELALHLTLPFQGFDVSFDVKSEVSRTNGADKSFAVRFTEIGERERELMQHFIEELVRGSMSDGDDTFRGRGGNDTFTGGAGMDTYNWAAKDVGVGLGLDHIRDFSKDDRLNLHDLLKGQKFTTLDDVVKLTDSSEGTKGSVKLGDSLVDVVVLDGLHGISAVELQKAGMILV